jgi:hypothetical protein
MDVVDGYRETREELRQWYGACQICTRRTPFDEHGDDSCETITSIISLRGGRYPGEFNKHSPENCLFLCPTHQTLYRRGLITMPYLEQARDGNLAKARKEVDSKIARLKSELAKRGHDDDIESIIFGVYDTPVADNFESIKDSWIWQEKEVKFKKVHLLQVLEWIRRYMDRISDE